MAHPMWFLLGYSRLCAERERAAELMNLFRQTGYVYRNVIFREERVYLECALWSEGRIRRACRNRGIPVARDRLGGLPSLVYRYRHRTGIFLGMVLFFAILFGSSGILWSIRVDGNDRLSDEEVIEELRQCGMTVGDRLKELDTGVLENRVLIASDEIGWISINLRGTVARVELRETVPIPEEERYTAANLVAERDGRIEWMEDVRGNVAVKVGDRVSEGELLVGGVYDIEQGGYRYTRARGRIFARTERLFETVIPLQYGKKTYTGEEKVEKYWIFFEKEGKFFRKGGNLSGSCDTINTVEYLTLPGDVRLPVGIRTVRQMEYVTEETERSPEAAMELAYYRLRCQMESEVPRGELVAKELTAELTETEYRLCCRAAYIEDIAKVQEIQIAGVFEP